MLMLLPCASAQTENHDYALYARVADAAMQRWPDGHIGAKDAAVAWGFEPGIALCGFNQAFQLSNNPHYFNYIRRAINQFVAADGSIRTYDPAAKSLNNILLGRQLLLLYRITRDEKYHKAADILHQQLLTQPLTPSGAFWHATATPNLVLLDDDFMFAPFMAEYAVTFHHPEDLKILAKQFELLVVHTRDARTGLLYHGWDETHSRAWVDPETGDSATLWARGMGWYMMALADSLPFYPASSPERAELLDIFQQTAAALIRVQSPESGLWYQVLDQPQLKGNYVESSSAMMLTYALQKGVLLGYLPRQYNANIARAWTSIQRRFVQISSTGEVSITGTVTHIALGAAPENTGSAGYYLTAPVVSDDPKGIGAFLMAATEMQLAEGKLGRTSNAAK